MDWEKEIIKQLSEYGVCVQRNGNLTLILSLTEGELLGVFTQALQAQRTELIEKIYKDFDDKFLWVDKIENGEVRDEINQYFIKELEK